MKKISLNGISEILSEKELKNVMGGSDDGCPTGQTKCYCDKSYQGCVSSVCECAKKCGVPC